MSTEMFQPKIRILSGITGYVLVIETLVPNLCYSAGEVIESDPTKSPGILEWDHLQAVINVAGGQCAEVINTITQHYSYPLGYDMPPPGKAGVTVYTTVNDKVMGCASLNYFPVFADEQTAIQSLAGAKSDQDDDNIKLLSVSGLAVSETIAGGDVKLYITAKVSGRINGYTFELIEAQSPGIDPTTRLMELVATKPETPEGTKERVVYVERVVPYMGNAQIMVYFGSTQKVVGPVVVAQN